MVTLSELADGAATLRLDDTGAPVNPLTVVDLDSAPAGAPPAGARGVVVGVGRATSTTLPWLTTVATHDELDDITATVAAAPLASVTLAGLLAVTAASSVEHGLHAESLSYSMLLAGPEFRAWRRTSPRRESTKESQPVLVSRQGDVLDVVLNRPSHHNAFAASVRNGLLEALAVAELDSSIGEVRLRGAGPSFSSGGDLDEFGTAADPVRAHVTRLVASAGWAVHRLRDRVRPLLHGACLGAGIEVPAFATRVCARDDAYFGLPELRFGLVPGAGGTVSVTRRIGRHRTAWLALTGRRIDLGTALAWGLVDERAR